jgi:hypothetical protein
MLHAVVSRFEQLVTSIRRSMSDAQALAELSESAAAMSRELAGVHERLRALRTDVAAASRRAEKLLAISSTEAAERAALAGMPRARLLSHSVFLDGSPSERMRVKRVSVGEVVERSFGRWIGITRCTSGNPEVRMLWERLLAFERGGNDVLRGLPSTILDVAGATVSREHNDMLRVVLRPVGRAVTPDGTVHGGSRNANVIAVARFAYDYAPRKRRNVGHWLLECLPQVVALSTVIADAMFLLPDPVSGIHRSTLSLVGVTDRQLLPWDGARLECARLLIFESDGRIGGGRPLSALMQMRRLLASTVGAADEPRTRRIYVSRRDATVKGSWVSNEPEVEEVFQRRGFEILVMSECPLHEQVRLFRDASVVAGVSGAGLADIVFSSSGIHVIVLLSDSLIRWYAAEGGSRAQWAGGMRAMGGQLVELGDSPRFYAHLAAACEQTCHSFVSPDNVPLDELTRFVDDVLGQLEAR